MAQKNAEKNQDRPSPVTVTIEVTANGITDPGPAKVKRKQRLEWQNPTGEWQIQLKDGVDSPFHGQKKKFRKKNANQKDGDDIAAGATVGKHYGYTIIAEGPDGFLHVLDPDIVIEPEDNP